MDHDELMKKHHARKNGDVFVPYQCRPSEGRCRYEDDGHAVRVIMDVAGLGTLVLTVVPRYNVTSDRLWNKDAVIESRIEHASAS